MRYANTVLSMVRTSNPSQYLFHPVSSSYRLDMVAANDHAFGSDGANGIAVNWITWQQSSGDIVVVSLAAVAHPSTKSTQHADRNVR